MIEVFRLIKSDFHQYTKLNKRDGFLLFLMIFFHNPGMLFSVMFRLEHYFLMHPWKLLRFIGFLGFPFFFLVSYYVLDFNIDPRAKIAKGMYVHNRGVIVCHTAMIGENVRLIGPLTIGTRLDSDEAPTMGNNVTLGTGCRVIGKVRIGDNVIVGANAVVVKDVPSNCVVGGVPARVIKALAT